MGLYTEMQSQAIVGCCGHNDDTYITAKTVSIFHIDHVEYLGQSSRKIEK